jgi:hypothetical protein
MDSGFLKGLYLAIQTARIQGLKCSKDYEDLATQIPRQSNPIRCCLLTNIEKPFTMADSGLRKCSNCEAEKRLSAFASAGTKTQYLKTCLECRTKVKRFRLSSFNLLIFKCSNAHKILMLSMPLMRRRCTHPQLPCLLLQTYH